MAVEGIVFVRCGGRGGVFLEGLFRPHFLLKSCTKQVQYHTASI